MLAAVEVREFHPWFPGTGCLPDNRDPRDPRHHDGQDHAWQASGDTFIRNIEACRFCKAVRPVGRPGVFVRVSRYDRSDGGPALMFELASD